GVGQHDILGVLLWHIQGALCNLLEDNLGAGCNQEGSSGDVDRHHPELREVEARKQLLLLECLLSPHWDPTNISWEEPVEPAGRMVVSDSIVVTLGWVAVEQALVLV